MTGSVQGFGLYDFAVFLPPDSPLTYPEVLLRRRLGEWSWTEYEYNFCEEVSLRRVNVLSVCI